LADFSLELIREDSTIASLVHLMEMICKFAYRQVGED